MDLFIQLFKFILQLTFRKGFTKSDKRTDREKELEKENAELREEVEILKKAAAFLANVKRD